MKSGNLNFLEPSGPLKACNGTALSFYNINVDLKDMGWVGVDWLTKWGCCKHGIEIWGSINCREFLDWLSNW